MHVTLAMTLLLAAAAAATVNSASVDQRDDQLMLLLERLRIQLQTREGETAKDVDTDLQLTDIGKFGGTMSGESRGSAGRAGATLTDIPDETAKDVDKDLQLTDIGKFGGTMSGESRGSAGRAGAGRRGATLTDIPDEVSDAQSVKSDDQSLGDKPEDPTPTPAQPTTTTDGPAGGSSTPPTLDSLSNTILKQLISLLQDGLTLAMDNGGKQKALRRPPTDTGASWPSSGGDDSDTSRPTGNSLVEGMLKTVVELQFSLIGYDLLYTYPSSTFSSSKDKSVATDLQSTDLGEIRAVGLGESRVTGLGESHGTGSGESREAALGKSYGTGLGESRGNGLGESHATGLGESRETAMGESHGTGLGESRGNGLFKSPDTKEETDSGLDNDSDKLMDISDENLDKNGDKSAEMDLKMLLAALKKKVSDLSEQRTTRSGPLPQIFHGIDTDGDGSIQLTEFQVFFTNIGLDANIAKFPFTAVDTNNDGTLSLAEFVTAGTDYIGGDARNDSKKSFWSLFDRA